VSSNYGISIANTATREQVSPARNDTAVDVQSILLVE
jgi:hypothetical protein